jgi:two-component system OmpR family sensor kinase
LTVRLGWPRSVRARLAVAWTLATAVLAAVGLALFAAMLHRGVAASVDVVLRTRAAAIVAMLDVPGTPKLDLPVPAPAAASPGPVDDAPMRSGAADDDRSQLDSFSAVYRPDGSLAGSAPTGVPFALLTSAQLASGRSGPQHFTLSSGDEPLRVLTVAVQREDGTWVVAVGTSLVPATEAADRAISDLDLSVPVLVALAALGAWVLAGAALRPVERMRADAEKLGEADSAGRITVPATADELAHLAHTFNALLDRLHQSASRQRDLIADAGHELRTPLAVLRTELELADGPERTREDLIDSLDHAREEVERLSKLAEDLLFLARADSSAAFVQLDRADISAVLGDVVRANPARSENLGISVDVKCPAPLVVQADPSALRRAVDNLVANAFAASGRGGRIELVARRGRNAVVLTVADSGPGFPDDFLAVAFGRFRRPDTARSSNSGGSGLGLAIVAEIVRAHGGSVSAANNPAGGALITVKLPARRESGSDATAVETVPRRRGLRLRL